MHLNEPPSAGATTSNPANLAVHSIWSIPPAWPGAGSRPGSEVAPIPLVSKVLGIGIVVAIAAPWLVHVIPASGPPLGPLLLPIFYAPMLAALLLRLPVAVAVSVATPIVSQQLTGMPPEAIVPSLMLQIACFVTAIRVLRALPWIVVVPVAYLVGLASSAVLTQVVGIATIDVAGTIQTGWPGIVALAGLGLLADRLLRRTTP